MSLSTPTGTAMSFSSATFWVPKRIPSCVLSRTTWTASSCTWFSLIDWARAERRYLAALGPDVDRQLLTAAIAKLSDREREIITLRFGLNGGREQTQKEVADRLGISQSYISRLEKRIISRLKREREAHPG